MSHSTACADELEPGSLAFFQSALRALQEAKVPLLVGGAYALARYTGIERHTKDFDLFVRPGDCPRALEVLARAGYWTELPFPHWLGKAFCGNDFIDLIFSSGNGLATVDDSWFEHGLETEVFDLPVRLCPPEETIWSKSFVMERERYDGADIAHLIRACGEGLDWRRLLARFGPHWRVLFNHLVLFGYVYPGERWRVPEHVTRELIERLQQEGRRPPLPDRVCQGTLLSREQYLIDIERWGYRDARLLPKGTMTREEIKKWTAPVRDEQAAVQGPSPGVVGTGP
jgi:hypothetical protein